MIKPIPLALCLSLAAVDATARELPLTRGFYVSTGTPCKAASAATLNLLGRTAINGSQDSCEFLEIVEETSTRFRVTERCADFRDPAGAVTTVRVGEILGAGAFRATREEDDWVHEARHCPQSSLPEPWRDNDISDVLR
jgi:hypothetical protein